MSVTSTIASRSQAMWPNAMPALFVLLWSTGFIGAKFGLPYAEPFTFLFIRFVLTVMLMLPLMWLFKASWPRSRVLWGHIAVTGLLMHGVYLSGVFYAIDLGLPAGLASLLVGLQPLLTSVLALPLLGERLSRWQWLGLVLGLLGITLVLSGKLAPGNGGVFDGFGIAALVCVLASLIAISTGTLYQKRFCSDMPLLGGSMVQCLAACMALGLAALLFETRQVTWTPVFAATLAWLVLGLSISAILLLMALIRRGAASRVASLFYLVPPLTALEAWLLFDETLGPVALTGMGVAILGVMLVIKTGAAPAPKRNEKA
ncbi:DMT family transporter [Halomonas sp. McH1-25]|uniref:DMT family transporter n=1 Tax=unclassified Halomonas TaxID=2609666 RepID=UPI001EF49DF1|nr:MULTISPECIES: DMT family transporter [unclassified Halomonas]MCG7600611.1 DMT family transporter [Halomonas sp. McH1-25]MCP1343234.1 DMT family transporter [Halomonas sp. FL8]MCP1359930.1 DMT family transporter [Halomonas sp. BBD45]MCP1365695.1 DMT family transporter [Halomonas sp. BBD48]